MKVLSEKSEKMKSAPPQVRRIVSLIAGEAAIFICGIIFFRLIIGQINMLVYNDSLSLLSIICMVFVMLMVTGLLKVFGSAFVYCVKDETEVNAVQMKSAAYSIKLSMITAVFTSVFIGISELIAVLFRLTGDEVSIWDYMFVYPFIDMWYGILAVLLLLPVYGRIKIKILQKER